MSSRRVKRTKHDSIRSRKRRISLDHENKDINHKYGINNAYSQPVITQNKGTNCNNKRRLNINLNASPIKTQQSRNESHLHSVHTLPYHFVDSCMKSKKSSKKLNKKRVSAPIILQSSTTPSVSSTTSGAIYITKMQNNNQNNHKKAIESPIKYTTPYNTPIGFSINNNNTNGKLTNINITTTNSSIDSNNESNSESEEYKIPTTINKMIKESRKSFRSRPRRYSKTRRLSTKLYDLMEAVSGDERNKNGKKEFSYSCFDDDLPKKKVECKHSEEEEKALRASHDYHSTLKKYGYIEIRKIAKSLQGIVIEAEYIDKTSRGWDSVIIKITDKKLHSSKISNKHGKALHVQEDIIQEKRLLMYLTANNPPSSLVEFLGFFSDEYNYFLVMENGGSDFFDWIVKCHEWIREGRVSMKQWNLYIRDLMVQVLELIHWLHRKMNVCHLDISLENMLIKNNKYKSDGNGGIRLSRKMQVKFCDFGLAEFFDNDFVCNKYVGKTHYKAPKVYGKKDEFDARKADIWSLGVSFFMIMIGAPPYKLPLKSDDHFPYIVERNVMGILKRWGRDHYINANVEELMNMMMEIDEDKRADIDELIKHKWFQNANKNNNNNNNKRIQNNNNVFQHLVTQCNQQQRLFRYKKRRLTNTK